MARPSEYDDAKADAICERLIEGESLRSICLSDDMPAQSTVCRWLANNETFRKQYAHAREAQADTLFDEILDIADDGSNDWMERKREDGSTDDIANHEHISRSKLRVDSRKWMAGKLRPKVYGDAALLKLADADGEKLHLPSVIAERRARVAGASDDV